MLVEVNAQYQMSFLNTIYLFFFLQTGSSLIWSLSIYIGWLVYEHLPATTHEVLLQG